MASGVDDVAGMFSAEIGEPASRPRDSQGKFVATTSSPESLFAPREVEGDPDTGDTRDGGDNEALRRHEREVANARREPDDAEAQEVDFSPEKIGLEESEEAEQAPTESEDGEKYEVTVDGQTQEVTLQEALRGYIRQETFHKWQSQLFEFRKALEEDYRRLQSNWALWDKKRKEYEEDFYNMIPREPDWDQKMAQDPRAAYEEQKVYRVLYSKLAASQQARAEREAAQRDEQIRMLQRYKDEAFHKFVAAHPKIFPDKATADRVLRAMRKTALAADFDDNEIDSIYDPRMLTVLLKASIFDRWEANKAKPLIPGKGRTLTPGAATPLGNAGRKGIDDAQRQLAKSGKVYDAAEVFRRILP